MDWPATIIRCSELLLADDPHPLELRRALAGLKEHLIRLVGLDPGQEENRQDLYLSTGKALGPTWAAHCLNDIKRTRQYVRGLRAAIEQHRNAGRKPVRILYAGSGPFATLVLPLIPYYSPTDIQITLLEINPVTKTAVNQLVEALGLQTHFADIHEVDAATYRIPDDNPPDILLTESMQAGMRREQQVSIFANLDAQAPQHATWVPETVDLSLALGRWAPDSKGTGISTPELKHVQPLMSFNRMDMAEWRREHGHPLSKKLFPGEIKLTAEQRYGYSELLVLTDICTFDNYWLHERDSSLTTPLVIEDLRRFSPTSLIFNYWYEVSDSPGLRFNLVEADTPVTHH